jgi:hypothetical protein
MAAKLSPNRHLAVTSTIMQGVETLVMQGRGTRKGINNFLASNAPFVLVCALGFLVGAAIEITSNHLPNAIGCIIMAIVCVVSID